MLLGGLLAFCSVGLIAVRCSNRFPNSLTWGLFLSGLIAFGLGCKFGADILPAYAPVATMTAVIAVFAGFIGLSYSRKNLSDYQYLAALSILILVLAKSIKLAGTYIFEEITTSAVLLLAVIDFLKERPQVTPPLRIAAFLLIFLGCSDLIGNILQHGFGAGNQAVSLPIQALALLSMAPLLNMRDNTPRVVWWVSIVVFGIFGVCSASSGIDSILASKLQITALAFFVVVISWDATVSERNSTIAPMPVFSHTVKLCGFLLPFSLMLIWSTIAFDLLAGHHSPVTMVAQLKWTWLWPGDKAFIRFAMHQDSLWGDDLQNTTSADKGLNSYLASIRPAQDEFSCIVPTKDIQSDDDGIVDAGLGIKWQDESGTISLLKVENLSPAGRHGLTRGDRIIGVNGKSIQKINKRSSWVKEIGKREAGSSVSLDILTQQGQRKSVSMTIGSVEQDPPQSRIIIASSGKKIGYTRKPFCYITKINMRGRIWLAIAEKQQEQRREMFRMIKVKRSCQDRITLDNCKVVISHQS